MTRDLSTVLLVFTLGIAFFLRAFYLDFESFWLDEAWSWYLISKGWSDFFNTLIYSDTHPFLYFVLLKLWSQIFGYSEISLRFPSIIFGLMSILVIWKIGEELFGKSNGIFCALLLAFSVYHIYYSREARTYSLIVFLSLLLIYLVIKFLKGQKYFIHIGLISALLMYLHYMTGFFLLSLNIGMIVILAYQKKDLLMWFLSQLIAFLVFLPWLAVFLRQFQMVKQSFWIPPFGLQSLAWLFGEMAFFNFLHPILIILSPVLGVLFILGLKALKEKKLFLLFLFITVVPVILVIFIGDIVLNRPLFYPRMMIYILPSSIIIFSAFIVKMKKLLFKTSLMIFLIITQIPSIINIYVHPCKENYREAVRILKSEKKQDEPLIVFHSYIEVPLSYYSMKETANRLFNDQPENWLKNQELPDYLEKSEKIWLISRFGEAEREGLIKLIEKTYRVVLELNLTNVNLFKFEKKQ